MRPIPKRALDFIPEVEGCELDSYADSGGVWTVGYGSTTDVHAGMRITKAEALRRLQADLTTARARLYGVVSAEVVGALSVSQYAALLSFVFNLGADPKWTIWKRLGDRRFDAVPAEMMRFVYVGKTRVAGLVNRRAAEVALWSTPDASEPKEPAPPSSVTRVEVTPPEPAATKPQFLAQAAQAVGGASAGAVAVQQVVAPHVTQAEILGKVVSAIAIFVVVCGVIMLVIHYIEKREAAR